MGRYEPCMRAKSIRTSKCVYVEISQLINTPALPHFIHQDPIRTLANLELAVLLGGLTSLVELRVFTWVSKEAAINQTNTMGGRTAMTTTAAPNRLTILAFFTNSSSPS